MAQITSGIRALLTSAGGYSLFQKFVGAPKARRFLAETYIRASPGDRVLDIGCGTAEILDFLPQVDYFGFDQNSQYIAAAQARFGRQGSFLCQDVNEALLGDLGRFDLVLALGVLHHLDDGEAEALFRLAKAALSPEGRLVTLDPCFVESQSPFARYVIRKDRGQNTRTEEGYVGLSRRVFAGVDSHIRHDLLNIPYTHIIMECHD